MSARKLFHPKIQIELHQNHKYRSQRYFLELDIEKVFCQIFQEKFIWHCQQLFMQTEMLLRLNLLIQEAFKIKAAWTTNLKCLTNKIISSVWFLGFFHVIIPSADCETKVEDFRLWSIRLSRGYLSFCINLSSIKSQKP